VSKSLIAASRQNVKYIILFDRKLIYQYQFS